MHKCRTVINMVHAFKFKKKKKKLLKTHCENAIEKQWEEETRCVTIQNHDLQVCAWLGPSLLNIF